MKITNSLCHSLCAFTFFISITSAFAKNSIEVRPVKKKATQKTEISKENKTTKVDTNVNNTTIACQPGNCIPIVITKSKTL